MTWKIQYFGKLRVALPDGRDADFPTRKSMALVALLALKLDRSLTSAELLPALWPDSESAKAQASLRQAIAAARKVLGSDVILTTKQSVRLSPNFFFTTDLDEAGTRDRGAFLPGLEGEAIDRLRSSHGFNPSPVATNLTENFLRLLRWYGVNDRDQMFELMRADLNLSLNLRPRSLFDITGPTSNASIPLRKMHGWDLFWEAMCSIDKRSAWSARSFRRAGQIGIDRRDLVLGVESFAWATCAHILSGELELAGQTISLGHELARKSQDRQLKLRLQELSATLLLHMGRYSKAVPLLRRAGESDDLGKIQWASNVASVALYEACENDEKPCHVHLSAAQKVADETKLERLLMICDLADGYLRLNGGDLPGAEKAFLHLVEWTERTDVPCFQIYGLEGLSVCRMRQNDRIAAREAVTESRTIRRNQRMPYSAWDRRRLRDVAPLLREAQPA